MRLWGIWAQCWASGTLSFPWRRLLSAASGRSSPGAAPRTVASALGPLRSPQPTHPTGRPHHDLVGRVVRHRPLPHASVDARDTDRVRELITGKLRHRNVRDLLKPTQLIRHQMESVLLFVMGEASPFAIGRVMSPAGALCSADGNSCLPVGSQVVLPPGSSLPGAFWLLLQSPTLSLPMWSLSVGTPPSLGPILGDRAPSLTAVRCRS